MDELVTAINTLQEMAQHLPPEYVAKIEVGLEVIGATSLVLAAVKPLVARWVTSPESRAWCDAVIKWFDIVASNTRGMDLRPIAEPKLKQEKKR